ncbi:MAG: hypothetical protein JST93_22325 [Acidobacteria bacterium]|nr:hypothetical protein [Acidobacteriota bacterium]
MTPVHSANLHLMKTQYLLDGNADRALEIMKKETGEESEFLRRLLRHHNKGTVSAQAEVRARDAFDFLLDYFALLEVGTLAGFVPAILPEEERAFAVKVLEQPNVREFYVKNYPLLLPKLYRLRLKNGVAPIPADGSAVPVFQQFLGVVEWQRRDDDIDAFLWFLDSGSYGRWNVSHLVRTLSAPDAYGESLLKEKRTPLDRGVAGYGKFLSLCLVLDRLLQDAAQWPLVQSAMYHYYEYWLRSLRKRASSVLKPTLRAMLAWNLREDDEKAGLARQDLQSAHDQIARLLQARYGAALKEAKY